MQAYLSFKPDLSEERHSFGSLITIDDAILKPGAKGFGLNVIKLSNKPLIYFALL
jgi:hypothetical protein